MNIHLYTNTNTYTLHAFSSSVICVRWVAAANMFSGVLRAAELIAKCYLTDAWR